ncbi:unnamed protein product [Prunus armeniaca]
MRNELGSVDVGREQGFIAVARRQGLRDGMVLGRSRQGLGDGSRLGVDLTWGWGWLYGGIGLGVV